MKDKLMMVLFVLILGSILTTALVGVDGFTAPKIEKNTELRLKSSVLRALEVPYEQDEIEQAFANNVKTAEKNSITYYVAADGTYALPYEGSGLWGPIRGIMAMNPDLKEIAGLTIMEQEETPGLGSRIAEDEYLEDFVSKRFSPRLQMVSPGTADQENEIDSISAIRSTSSSCAGRRPHDLLVSAFMGRGP